MMAVTNKIRFIVVLSLFSWCKDRYFSDTLFPSEIKSPQRQLQTIAQTLFCSTFFIYIKNKYLCSRMKIFAIGMNYAAHNQELHGTLKRPDEPVIFTKADSAILNQGKPFFIPDHLSRIDYETEVVVRICRLGKNIPERLPIATMMR